ncbi:hypothetical protein CXB51_001174 [Gossypium anomalum]|uniref:Uncharacterized protein n=1 Tax=Gossypium anomalum TaxID=47600 RepID=A0A8J6D9C3_9ROSI|nr:hypothetical protein CXB51_001174 [Gossypium anomalum]
MLGTGLGFRRVRGEDRFYNPAKARRSYQKQQTDQLRRAQSDYTRTMRGWRTYDGEFQPYFVLAIYGSHSKNGVLMEQESH